MPRLHRRTPDVRGRQHHLRHFIKGQGDRGSPCYGIACASPVAACAAAAKSFLTSCGRELAPAVLPGTCNSESLKPCTAAAFPASALLAGQPAQCYTPDFSPSAVAQGLRKNVCSPINWVLSPKEASHSMQAPVYSGHLSGIPQPHVLGSLRTGPWPGTHLRQSSPVSLPLACDSTAAGACSTL